MPYQPALGAIKIHHAGRGAFEAHFLFHGGTAEGIACAGITIGIRQEFRHQEQADAFRPFGCARQTGQHQMNDVVGVIVFALGNEDLGAGNGIAAIGLRFRLGLHQAHVAAGMGLGQTHGTGPLGCPHLRQIQLLEFVGGMRFDGTDGAMGQCHDVAPGDIRGEAHFVEDDVQAVRQPLPTPLLVDGNGGPAIVAERIKRRLESRRHGDLAIIPGNAVLITAGAKRRQFIFGEFRAFGQDGIDQIPIDVTVTQRLILLLGIEDFVDQELHIADGRFVLRHNASSLLIGRGGRLLRVHQHESIEAISD